MLTETSAARSTLLLGPGPSNAPQAVLDALGQSLIGHLDPRFIALMEETKARLRTVYGTANEVTFPVSGTGSAGMEAVLVNILEPGDTIVVGQNGVFGMRIANLAERYGARAIRVEQEWGKAMTLDQLAPVVREHKPKILAVVSGETSTGVYQPMAGLGELAHENGALLLADCVTSAAGMPVLLDEWGVDLMYSGTQKCLNCPPGLAPVTFSARALEVFAARKTPVPSFYLDLGEILKYLGDNDGAPRAYHHTAPVSMVAGLHAALGLVIDEGLEARWQRHQDAQHYLLEKIAPYVGALPFTRAHIVTYAVTKYVIKRIGFTDVFGFFANDNDQFAFVFMLFSRQGFRKPYGITRIIDGIGQRKIGYWVRGNRCAKVLC